MQEDAARPHAWDMAGILRFAIVMEIVSSVFDAATFLIRTRRLPWRAT